ncbi:thiol-disulfide oxidoreductase DCC family protein [Flavobacterium sp. AS60]|uniref:thiol-disulfide oxidoreductase DCC family protein n=1 Tax=Flavobacterium anseongense TaxID=2910677 RepID=UPI001F48B2C5|nr:thiol-disulfide oxidoreductase DCC family protein [Flavobacterium sp. AS60]
MSELPKDKKIILFDGVCNLCDSSVQFVIKHDKKDIFRFIPLQSELGQKMINHIGISASAIDSTILYENDNAYYKAQAAFRILKDLNSPYRFLLIFSILPNSVSNFIYDYIAKNRYKWFGKKVSCMIPTPELKSKFLA